MQMVPYMLRDTLTEYRRRRQMALDAFWRAVFWWAR